MIDIFETINEASEIANDNSNSIPAVDTHKLDDLNLIPVAYQICKLVNGKIENGIVISGSKTIIDTLHCDREKNYTPNQRAIDKANCLKSHDTNNTYFVVGIYNQLKQRPVKKTFVVMNNQLHEIIHEAVVTTSNKPVHFVRKGRGNAFYQR